MSLHVRVIQQVHTAAMLCCSLSPYSIPSRQTDRQTDRPAEII